jgi:hypothetical protein
MNNEQRCATCRYWDPSRDRHDSRDSAFKPDWGDCDLVNGTDGDPLATIMAYYCDSAYFTTAPDFGCIQWEAKP